MRITNCLSLGGIPFEKSNGLEMSSNTLLARLFLSANLSVLIEPSNHSVALTRNSPKAAASENKFQTELLNYSSTIH